MAADAGTLGDEIMTFLRTKLRVANDGIALDTPLVSTGLVDSVALVRLASFVEQRTGLRIPDRDVTVQHFDSLMLILAYVARRQGRSA